MAVEIRPEPTDDERAAILEALDAQEQAPPPAPPPLPADDAP